MRLSGGRPGPSHQADQVARKRCGQANLRIGFPVACDMAPPLERPAHRIYAAHWNDRNGLNADFAGSGAFPFQGRMFTRTDNTWRWQSKDPDGNYSGGCTRPDADAAGERRPSRIQRGSGAPLLPGPPKSAVRVG